MEREILLFSQIEPATVAQVDQWLSALEAAGARTATMRINSPGGSWHAGQLIRSRMQMSKVAVTTVNEGLVGSAATLPYIAGKTRQCQPHAKFMMHQVSNDVGYVNEGELTKALQAQQALNRSTAEMYASVSSVSADEWGTQMASEKWYNAQDAKTIGFCTQVLPGSSALAAPDAGMSVTDVHKFYMSYLTPEPEMKIDEVRNALKLAGVNLADNATEADALAAIGKLKNVVPDAPKEGQDEEESELDKLKKQVQQLLNSGQAEQTRRIEDTVNNAVTAGKIPAAQKDTYKALLGADYTNTSKLLDGMPGRQSVAQRTNQNAAKGLTDTARNDWDFEKFSKEDPKALREIKQNDPERYQNLVNGYIG